jgi:hypothetical protein
MKRVVLPGVLALSLHLATTAVADDCCRSWDEWVAMCQSHGMTALPNPPRCVADVAPDAHTQRLQRYQAAFNRSRSLIGGSAPSSATDEELVSLATSLHGRLFDVVAAARLREAAADARLEVVSPAVEELEKWNDELYARYRDELVPELRGEQQRFARLQQDLAQAKAVSGRIERAEYVYEKRADARKADVARWARVVLPRSPMIDELRPPLWLGALVFGEPIQRPLEEEPAPLHALLPVLRPPVASKTYTRAATPLLEGSFDDRMARVERLLPKVSAAVKSADASDEALEDALGRYDEYAGLVRAFLRDIDQAQQDIHAARTGAREAQHGLEGQRAHSKVLTEMLFYHAAEDLIFTRFKKDVLVPELKRLVLAAYHGRPPSELTEELVRASWDTETLHVFPLVAKVNKGRDAAELARRTVRLFQDGINGAQDAAVLLATADPAEARAYAAELFDRLDQGARAEAEQALEVADIPQPYKDFWLSHFPK